MHFMNDYDIDDAVRRHGDHPDYPNLAAAVRTLENLRDWANDSSDGWAYWPKPARAADRLMTIIEDANKADWYCADRQDVDRATLVKAYSPIKAFLSRQNVSHADIVVPAQEV